MIWRQLLFIFVATLLWSVGYVAVSGFVAGNFVKCRELTFPPFYREPGPYRTAFVEAATKKCIRDGENAGVPKDKALSFCDCRAAVVATFITAEDLQEIAHHVTERYRKLAETADAACDKALTGQ